MRVNINCGAALGDHNACGYAFWIKSKRSGKSGRGHTRWPIDNIGIAHMVSCVNALNYGINKGLIDFADIVTIQTRSTYAYEMLSLFVQPTHPMHTTLIKNLTNLENTYRLKIIMKLITNRQEVNTSQWDSLEACGRYARKEMLKMANHMQTQLELNPQKVAGT